MSTTKIASIGGKEKERESGLQAREGAALIACISSGNCKCRGRNLALSGILRGCEELFCLGFHGLGEAPCHCYENAGAGAGCHAEESVLHLSSRRSSSRIVNVIEEANNECGGRSRDLIQPTCA